ncbi:helix-turn-helix domain-containing protein [Streptantibioticus cattleyicolor]|uniref:HTH cro/C1-type domain-containing protein n=1 Tax=Streptantibioticus cattleyicolor (strain ATCC 35852 / DSM 46488 / JCM 4925 / NBRC 14057 / NRRL 8057) TaxID=1003195 RepID=F8JNL3_STREN|nr:helix-turn-helix domain-containing protein [Streptantibioticus cattleyicolor]AEW99020.1 hypothetical protein SCATT_p08270 [Streptantibioticus cattleyicolor NRRL 8057 = DSM 46488]CCB71933.1 conserved protein of unknown function [Streptantibioticus cattleyicolor NRRL 8057 = DSM 46488]
MGNGRRGRPVGAVALRRLTPTQEERREKLAFLGQARERVDRSVFEAKYPSEVPRHLPGRGRRAKGLTQLEVGRLLGLRDGTWYAELERGLISNAPEERLLQIAELLGLTARQYEFLRVYACRPRPQYQPVTVPDGYRDVLDLYQGPAYIQDHCWNLMPPRMYNAHAEALLAGIPDDFNFLRWMLLNEKVRKAPENGAVHAWLPQFWEVWAPRALSVARATFVRHPDDPTLAQLDEELAADPDIGPLYRGKLPLYAHTDGDLRPFAHGTTGEVGWVRINVLNPHGSGATLLLLNWKPAR